MSVCEQARRWAATSGLVAFVGLPRLRANPHPIYRTLRGLDPAHHSPLGISVLSGHADVTAALRNPLLGSDEAKAAPMRLPALLRPLERVVGSSPEARGGPATTAMASWMLFRDPPDHTRLRGLVNKAFTPRAVESLEGRVTEIVDARLDAVADRGTMEFLSEFAYPVPALVICELIGAPLSDHEIISRHAPAIATRLDPSPMRNAGVELAADRAVAELSAYVEDLIATKRRAPGDDLTSRLLAAHDGGDHLSHEEVVSTLILLFMAGHETTANLLANGLLTLLRHPDVWDRYRRRPDLDRRAVEELLRYEGPIQMAERIALDDVEVNGHRIPAGRIVVLCLAAANRDPAAFPGPDRLIIDRDPNPHVGFGGGAHFCIGASLARMEARIGLRRVADRLDGLRVQKPSPAWRPSFTIRGLTHLNLAWDGRR